MKKYIVFLLLFFLPAIIFSKIPEWVKNYGKTDRFPEQIYITGFGMAMSDRSHNKAECINISRDNARAELIKKIRVTIESLEKSRIEEDDSKYSQYYCSIVNSISNLDVTGLEMEIFFDKKSHIAYAYAYIRRTKLIDHNTFIIDDLKGKIKKMYASAEQAENEGRYTQALKNYLACYPVFKKIFKKKAVISALENNLTMSFREIDNCNENDMVNIEQVDKAVNRLYRRPLKNIDDLAGFICRCFKGQLSINNNTIAVLPLTYQDTGMSSRFANYFRRVIEKEINSITDLNVKKYDMKLNMLLEVDKHSIDLKAVDYVLTGSYWEYGDSIKVIVNICDSFKGFIKAGSDILVPADIITNSGLDIKPENFKAAVNDQQIFRNEEMINSGLVIKVWTDKGVDGLLYTQGESMHVYMGVNIPCYIRFIYHLADGRRTVLLDNHYIDRSEVNRVYRIPEEFICDRPFGVEVLQIFARTEPFEHIDTVEKDGYHFLKCDLISFLAKTRGMKRKEQRGFLQTESRLLVTTMEK